MTGPSANTRSISAPTATFVRIFGNSSTNGTASYAMSTFDHLPFSLFWNSPRISLNAASCVSSFWVTNFRVTLDLGAVVVGAAAAVVGATGAVVGAAAALVGAAAAGLVGATVGAVVGAGAHAAINSRTASAADSRVSLCFKSPPFVGAITRFGCSRDGLTSRRDYNIRQLRVSICHETATRLRVVSGAKQ